MNEHKIHDMDVSNLNLHQFYGTVTLEILIMKKN